MVIGLGLVILDAVAGWCQSILCSTTLASQPATLTAHEGYSLIGSQLVESMRGGDLRSGWEFVVVRSGDVLVAF